MKPSEAWGAGYAVGFTIVLYNKYILYNVILHNGEIVHFTL